MGRPAIDAKEFTDWVRLELEQASDGSLSEDTLQQLAKETIADCFAWCGNKFGHPDFAWDREAATGVAAEQTRHWESAQ